MKQLPRSRPTNNQLLYKAHFRWEHYTHRQIHADQLPIETEPCASVTAAFLKVLGILQRVESGNCPKRNILQILATNTRRTKVLELSSGTHRIPDELKKHYLTDDLGAQYSTNLDRNRYGSDNNYLFTVIKHDLETLSLCPCLVDVEIIDAKAQGDSQLVTAGPEACICASRGTAVPVQQPIVHGNCSQLFEALVAAAADATEAETDTAAQEVAAHDCFEQTKEAANHVVNGLLPAIQPAPVDTTLTPSPGKRNAPHHVHTGIFSVNSSDLMGCGFSNLGNSGLVVGDLDLDRKGEVEQRPTSKRSRRVAIDPDTVSEQGDTDRYLKSIIAEAPDEPWRHVRVPRQNSMVGVADGGTKDAHTLVNDVQHLQQNQAVMRSTIESHKRSAVENDQRIGELQRGVQALHEDRTRLQAMLESTEKRVIQLEACLSQNSAQIKAMHQVIMRLVPSDREGVASVLQQMNPSMPIDSIPQTVIHHDRPAHLSTAVPSTAEAYHGNDSKVTLARYSTLDGIPNGQVPIQTCDAGLTIANPNKVAAILEDHKGPPVLKGGIVQKFTPQPQADQGPLRGASSRPEPIPDMNGHPGLGMVDAEPQLMPELVKMEDCETFKKLANFETFGSLSDFGSLFSGGAGKSVDARPSSSKQPPRANVSITSPHPALVTKAQGSLADGKEEAPPVS